MPRAHVLGGGLHSQGLQVVAVGERWGRKDRDEWDTSGSLGLALMAELKKKKALGSMSRACPSKGGAPRKRGPFQGSADSRSARQGFLEKVGCFCGIAKQVSGLLRRGR